MKNEPQQDIISPSGKYTIQFGEVQEYSMGGAYACPIYLVEDNKPPFLICSTYCGDVRFTEDEHSFYFLYQNIDRNVQVMQYIINVRVLKTFKDVYQSAEFENVHFHGYSVHINRYVTKTKQLYEGFDICDTNPESVQTKQIIIPDYGSAKINTTEKTFNPDYEYSFWFFKQKYIWVIEMLGLVIDYEFADGELDGMYLRLAHTNDEDKSTWSGGLHYGNKGTLYISSALDAEDRDIVHLLISSNEKLKSKIEFVDLLQCKYKSAIKWDA
jgi:hypothetical protein